MVGGRGKIQLIHKGKVQNVETAETPGLDPGFRVRGSRFRHENVAPPPHLPPKSNVQNFVPCP